MNADLLVELSGYQPCAVCKSEFIPLLEVKGWHQIDSSLWTSPAGIEPDAAFDYLTRGLTPRRLPCPNAEGDMAIPNLPMFCRRHRDGIDVWAIH